MNSGCCKDKATEQLSGGKETTLYKLTYIFNVIIRKSQWDFSKLNLNCNRQSKRSRQNERGTKSFLICESSQAKFQKE